MKKVLKIIIIVFVLIFGFLIAAPFVFKNRVKEVIKEEINASLNAKVDFSDVGLSLIRNFPDLSVKIKDLLITGVDVFENDTLCDIESILLKVDIKSLFGGNTLLVKTIEIRRPNVNLRILEDGSANYDIVPESDDPGTEGDHEKTDPITFSLKKFIIDNGNILYDDVSGTSSILKGLDFYLSGDLSAEHTNIKTNIDIASLSVISGGIKYLKDVRSSLQTVLLADLVQGVYSLGDSRLGLNELVLILDGSFAMPDEGYHFDLNFHAPKNEFRNFLSLVPAIYSNSFKDLDASGKLSLSGYVKGLYSENSMPAYKLDVNITEGQFKYPDLPSSVDGIELVANIDNKTGVEDNTVIDIKSLMLNMGGNPFKLACLIKNPVSDPYLKGEMTGNIDLGLVPEFYPMEDVSTLKGKVVSDIRFDGRLSDVENKRYRNVDADGKFEVSGLEYQDAGMADPLEISRMKLSMSPAYLDVPVIIMKQGNNNILAKGKLENYLAWYFDKSPLKGDLIVQSDYLDLDELSADDETNTSKSAGSESNNIIDIPDNIDIQFRSSIKTLKYYGQELKNVNSLLQVRNGQLNLNDLSSDLLDGRIGLNGTYKNEGLASALANVGMNLKELDVNKAYEAFGMMKILAPIAKNLLGKFSTTLNMKTMLGSDMLPVYESMAGKGNLVSSALVLKSLPSMEKLSEVLHINEFRNIDLKNVHISYEIKDGKVTAKPFELKFSGITAMVDGFTGFDKSIGYTMKLTIPRSMFGSAANNVLNDLIKSAESQGVKAGIGDFVNIDVFIGGTIDKPTIKTGLKGAVIDLKEEVIETVKEIVEEKTEEVKQDVKAEADKILKQADEQAEKLLAEAHKQADMVRKNAADGGKKIREEADKEALKLIAEGKKNGFIAEQLAKTAAEKLKSEAYNTANSLEKEADKQATAITDKAQLEADKIRNEARKKVEEL